MIRDPAFSYQDMGRQFSISRQRVGQIAETARVNEGIAQRQRALRSTCFYDSGRYPDKVRGYSA
jgi:hypothetical protein